VILLIAAEPLGLMGQLASLSFDGDTAIAVLGSGFGQLLALRLGGALLVWALRALETPWPILGVGAVIALVDGASAHAIAGLPGVGQMLVAVHVGSVGLWVGGLAAFLMAPDRRFGRYAAILFGIAVITGLALAASHVGLSTALMTSEYGLALIAKVLVVGAVVSFAVLRRRRLEFGALLAVLAVAALLAALPPPR
jgi:copper resistance protein D